MQEPPAPPPIDPPGGEQAHDAQIRDRDAQECIAEVSRYLVHMRVRRPSYSEESVEDQIREAASAVLETLGHLSGGECHSPYASEYGGTFGIFINTRSDPDQIQDAVQALPAFRDNDELFALELYQRFTAIGDSAACAWLQHH